MDNNQNMYDQSGQQGTGGNGGYHTDPGNASAYNTAGAYNTANTYNTTGTYSAGAQGTEAPYTAAPYTAAPYTGGTGYEGGQYAGSQYNGGQYAGGQYAGAQYMNGQYNAGNPVIESSNRGLGVLGAALGALVGGAVWTGIGCLGFISGWIAVLIFVLALYGYKLFTKKQDLFGNIISAVFCLIVIFPATWAAYAFSVWKALNEGFGSGFSYMEVLFDLGSYMDRYELWGNLGANLLMGYGFTLLVAFFYVIGSIKK